MEIQGPFTIAINDNSETGLRELHLGFKPGFQQLELADRLATLKSYIDQLNKDIATEIDAKNQQGMLTIAQIAQELYPHLKTNEIPLDETIIVEIGPSQSSPFDDLLRGATLK
jgi:hypothetical protein